MATRFVAQKGGRTWKTELPLRAVGNIDRNRGSISSWYIKMMLREFLIDWCEF